MNGSYPRQPSRLTLALGMHRSGTSLCAHVLSLLGLDMADEISPHESNAKGHWERWEVMRLNDRVFQHFGQDYYDERHALPLPAGWWADPTVRRIRDEILAWLRARMGNSQRFGLKDPRISRLLPMWREIISDLAVEPRFVVCVRDPQAVAASLSARDKFDIAEGHFRWLTYTTDLINGLGDSRVAVLPYDRWFSDPGANFAALRVVAGIRGAGDPGLAEAVEQVVDRALRHRSGSDGAPVEVTAKLYRALLDAAPAGMFDQELRQAAVIAAAFARFVQPVREELLGQRRAYAALEAANAELSCAPRSARERLAETGAEIEPPATEAGRRPEWPSGAAAPPVLARSRRKAKTPTAP